MQVLDRSPNKTLHKHPFTLVHGFYAIMGGYAFDVPNEDENNVDVEESKRRAILTPEGVQFLMVYDPDLILADPVTSITDRSKSNVFNKALLVAQVAWFCVSCVSRLADGLPLTLIEIITAAHGLCTLATYAVWWYKPLNIDEPTLIREHGEEESALLRMTRAQRKFMRQPPEVNQRESDFSVGRGLEFRVVSQQHQALDLRAAKRYGQELEAIISASLYNYALFEAMQTDISAECLASTLAEAVDFGSARIATLVAVLLPAVYGLVHLFGWNAQFPSLVERSLWRIATAAICSSGVVFSAMAWVSIALDEVELLTLFIFGFLGLYVLSTMYLLLESIRQLFYLPPEAFVVTSWSNYLPHFS